MLQTRRRGWTVVGWGEREEDGEKKFKYWWERKEWRFWLNLEFFEVWFIFIVYKCILKKYVQTLKPVDGHVYFNFGWKIRRTLQGIAGSIQKPVLGRVAGPSADGTEHQSTNKESLELRLQEIELWTVLEPNKWIIKRLFYALSQTSLVFGQFPGSVTWGWVGFPHTQTGFYICMVTFAFCTLI